LQVNELEHLTFDREPVVRQHLDSEPGCIKQVLWSSVGIVVKGYLRKDDFDLLSFERMISTLKKTKTIQKKKSVPLLTEKRLQANRELLIGYRM
jgi:hypothetical protein